MNSHTVVSDNERKELRDRISTLPDKVGFGTHLSDEPPLNYPGARAQLGGCSVASWLALRFVFAFALFLYSHSLSLPISLL